MGAVLIQFGSTHPFKERSQQINTKMFWVNLKAKTVISSHISLLHDLPNNLVNNKLKQVNIDPYLLWNDRKVERHLEKQVHRQAEVLGKN